MAITDLLDLTLPEEGQAARSLYNTALDSLDDQWFPRVKRVPPVLADTTWLNQETATITDANGVLFLRDVAHNGPDMRIRELVAPATPYVLTAGMISANQRATASVKHGLIWRQSSDGKIVALQCGTANNGTHGIQVTKYTGEISAQTDYADGFFSIISCPRFFRIADNGTNRICSLSEDGINFLDIHTVARTDHLTADRIGFMIDSNSAVGSFPFAISLFHWSLT